MIRVENICFGPSDNILFVPFTSNENAFTWWNERKLLWYLFRSFHSKCVQIRRERQRKKKERTSTHTHTHTLDKLQWIHFFSHDFTYNYYLLNNFFFLHEALYVDFNQNYWASRMIGRRISCRRILSFSLLNNSIIRFELLNNYLKTDGGSLGSLRKNAFES